MKIIKRISITIFLGVVGMSIYGCSSDANQYSPDQVIHNALKEIIPAYYGEVEIITNHQDVVRGEVMQEWRSDDGKIRIESEDLDGTHRTISVNNGSVLKLYELEQNKAFIIEDPKLLSLNQPSPKEQTNKLLESLRDTHEISTKQGEKIADRDTHQLHAKPIKSGTLFGEVELWIDKETWLVLKMVLHTGDAFTEMTYTKIDFNPKLSHDLFTIDLPEDVEIENMLSGLEIREVLLEEISIEIGESTMYFPETEDLKISLIELYDYQDELTRNEVSIDYIKNDLPLLTLLVFETENPEVEDIVEGETIKVRNQKGMYIEQGSFRSVFWDENGITYSIVLIDPNLTLAEILQMTEEMEFVK